jgi:hypothetical protein
MTLRSSCDSIKTPMEFDRCLHAIFYFFSKYQYSKTYTLRRSLNNVNYLNIIKRDHVSATVRTRLHLASGWSNDHSGA